MIVKRVAKRAKLNCGQCVIRKRENDMNFQAPHDVIDALQVVKISFLDFLQINVTRQSL
jgi:hypothetical protein